MTRGSQGLNDLRLMIDVARLGSLGKAAALARTSQPSLSRRIGALERGFGLELFSRSTQGMRVTARGKLVVEWATELLEASEKFDHSVRSLRDGVATELRVAVSMTIAEYYAPQWLALLRVRRPEAFAALRVLNSADVIRTVSAGDCDLGFVETPLLGEAVQGLEVGNDPLALAVTADHPWARNGGTVDVAELVTAGLLLREQGSGTRETVDQELRLHGHVIEPSMQLASNTALKAAAVAGIGPVILSRRALQADLDANRLVEIVVRGATFRRPLSGVWRPRQRLGPAARLLLDLAKETT